MVLLYKGCLETKRALQIQTVLPPKGEYKQVPMEKVVGEKQLKPQFWPIHLLSSLLNLRKVR